MAHPARNSLIGLVDGSAVPPPFIRPQRGSLDEVLTPSFVVPDPDDELILEDGARIRLVDAQLAADAVAGVRETEYDAEPKAAEAVNPLGLSIKDVADAGDDPNGRPSHAAESYVDNSPPSAEPEGTGGSEPSEATLPDREEDIENWIARREHSLFWRLAEHVRLLRTNENATADHALHDATNGDVPSTKKLVASRNLLVISWLIGVLGTVSIILWLVLDARLGSGLLPALSVRRVGLAVALVVGVVLAGGILYFRSLRAYEWSVMQRMHRIRQASDEFVDASQQARRWQMMYEGTMDWAAILGPLLHRPWLTADKPRTTGDVSYATLPASVAVARPVDAENGSEPDVIVRSVEAICQRGWLEEEFDRYVESSQQNNQRMTQRGGSCLRTLILACDLTDPARNSRVRVLN